MSQEIAQYKAPSIQDLIADKDMAFAQDDLNVILNTPVPEKWIKKHPYVNIKINGQSTALPYLPVKRVKYLLKRIFGKYQWEIKECKQVLNAMVVIGKLSILNPITGEWEHQDGVGAAAIQMDAGATQGDLTAIKANAIQIGAPAAESYALKNAAEKFGDIFGGNIYDVDQTSYSPVFSDDVRAAAKVSKEDLRDLFELKKEALKPEEIANAERILNNDEKLSFAKLYKQLQAA